MAQKITTTLVDDLNGDTIEDGKGRTVTFGFDGAHYEIDLTDDNADALREAFSDYVAAARKVSGRLAAQALVAARSVATRRSSRRFASGPQRTATRSPRVAESARPFATRTTPRTDTHERSPDTLLVSVLHRGSGRTITTLTVRPL